MKSYFIPFAFLGGIFSPTVDACGASVHFMVAKQAVDVMKTRKSFTIFLFSLDNVDFAPILDVHLHAVLSGSVFPDIFYAFTPSHGLDLLYV